MNPIKVTIVKRNTEYEIKPGMTLRSALKILDILPETVLANRNGNLILGDEILKEGEKIILVDVISGG